MATEDVRVTNAVEIKSESEARVAYELMIFIANREEAADQQKKSRDHWLTLYLQCRRATREAPLTHVLDRT